MNLDLIEFEFVSIPVGTSTGDVKVDHVENVSIRMVNLFVLRYDDLVNTEQERLAIPSFL